PLDGDDLRAGVSVDRVARREQARRATRLALEHAEDGAIAIVCLVSPYAVDRAEARAAAGAAGTGFVEIFVDTPAELCRERDPKGLYAAAAAGEIEHVTGWDDPYEPPATPDVRVTPDADGVTLVLAAIS
ncbi:MAG TPA: adenylyl-sulfate kinase, partial [Solirubrobacteraceae bacterium]